MILDIYPCCLFPPSLPWPPYIRSIPPRWGRNDARAAIPPPQFPHPTQLVRGHTQIRVRSVMYAQMCRLDVDSSDYRQALVGVALRSAAWASIHTLGRGLLLPLSKVDRDYGVCGPKFVLFIQQSICVRTQMTRSASSLTVGVKGRS